MIVCEARSSMQELRRSIVHATQALSTLGAKELNQYNILGIDK
jgi:hypothetical protein